MMPGWILGILLAIFSVISGVALYFLSQRQRHYALWTGIFAIVILLSVIVMYLRNQIIETERKESLAPKIKVGISPDDNPSVNPFKYPLQEYHLHIHKENKDSAPAQGLIVKFYFPNLVSQISGHTYVHAGENIFMYGMTRVDKGEEGITVTKDIPAETAWAKSMSLSVQKWQKNDELANSNIVVFSCDKWSEKAAFVGSIVIDLSKKPEIVKLPGQIGTYTGEYYYEFKGERLPPIPINGTIPEPYRDKKLAEHHYDLGMELMKRDECNQAVTEFTSAINLNSQHDHAYFKRALCYGKLQSFEKAISDLDRVVEISPRYAKAYFYRALAKKDRGDSVEDIEEDFWKACKLKLKKGCKEYGLSKLSTVNPSDGWFSFTYSNEKWLEPNNEFIDIIPHISKDDFEIHIYRDKDNVFKALISNAFSKNVILQYKDFERLKKAPNHPEHEIKMTWYKGDNKLYIDGVLVDVYPKEVESSSDELKEGTSTDKTSDGDLFRALYNIGPEKGRIGFTVSKEGWLEDDGKFINILPHIYVPEHNFEVHGYRDKNFIFKVLISTPFSQDVILAYSDLEGLKDYPDHPKHCIWVTWNKEEKNLYIDGTEAVDTYPRE